MAQPGALKRTGTMGHSGAQKGVRGLLPPVVGGLVLLVTLLGLIGNAIRDPRPHDIPVGLVGPDQAVQQISTAFSTNAPGAFRFTIYGSESDARAALDARTVDGVVVLGGPGPRIIVAGAAGDAASGVITAAFSNVFKAQGAAPSVETVHPFAAGDPHGLILFFVVLAVIISSFVAQAILYSTAAGAGFGARLGVIAAFSILAALTAMGTATWIAGDYGSGFWTAVGALTLGSAAIGAAVAGSARLLGAAGLGLAALVVVLLSLISSGGPVGSQMLPDFYRGLSPLMPAGELYGGLRGALYFDGAGLENPLIVLTAWLIGGLVLMGLGELVAARRGRRAAATAEAQ